MEFLKDLSKGKLLGHPIHVMLVHFPLALFPVSLIFDVIAYLNSDPSLAIVSFYALGCGVIGAYLAVLFGMIDLIHLPNEKSVWKKVIIHASINGIIVFSYTLLSIIRLKEYPEIEISSLAEISINGVLNILLIIAAHYGGDLIFRHKVGVIKKEKG